jgi:flagellar protein FlaG
MSFEAVTLQSVNPQMQSGKSSDEISLVRKKKEDQVQGDQVEKKQVQAEEILSKIKMLTEDGLYSVRFENSDEAADQLVVKIVDQETDEVIRQVPAEEVLELRQALDDLRGNIVDTRG